MEAIVLAGGQGTRLSHVVPHLPKSLAPIQKTPFLSLLLEKFSREKEISKVILALGHKASQIEEFIKDTPYRFQVDVSIEKRPLGTGGAILHALERVAGDEVLIVNGDSYSDLSLSSFFSFHHENGADFSVACCKVDDISRYGSLEIDSLQRIRLFLEKSSQKKEGWINAGIYLAKKSLFQSFPLGSYSLEKDFFPLFLQKRIFAYLHHGMFIDIGTESSYWEAQEILSKQVGL